MMRFRLSYANVIATLALFFALTGGAVSASTLTDSRYPAKGTRVIASGDRVSVGNASTMSMSSKGIILRGRVAGPGGVGESTNAVLFDVPKFGRLQADCFSLGARVSWLNESTADQQEVLQAAPFASLLRATVPIGQPFASAYNADLNRQYLQISQNTDADARVLTIDATTYIANDTCVVTAQAMYSR
jgi:hypothetical protein